MLKNVFDSIHIVSRFLIRRSQESAYFALGNSSGHSCSHLIRRHHKYCFNANIAMDGFVRAKDLLKPGARLDDVVVQSPNDKRKYR